jgi:formylglycine-generating enzyme
MKRIGTIAGLLLWVGGAAANPQMVAKLPGGATMAFVWIEPGTFMMGSPESDDLASGDESPQHQVTITQGFWLGRCEVAQGQWEAVMGTAPWSGEEYVRASAGYPAVYLSWTDTQELIQRLNQAQGQGLYRLPTEAEWEYACRARTTTRWSCADDDERLRDYAWYEKDAWEAGLTWAQPTGAKLANPYGLYDMHGNVWEWCQDWYGGYPGAPQADPGGAEGGLDRVFRGGAFGYGAPYLRSACRGHATPGSANYVIGARLVRVGPEPGTAVAPHPWGAVKRQAR